jgi:hypothetical protein
MMRNRFSQVVEQFFTPKAFVPFLIGSLMMAVIGNEATKLFEEFFGTTWRDALQIIISAIAVLGFCIFLLQRWLARMQPQTVELIQAKPGFRRGLILLVSRPETCRRAIEYHLPILERCWLLCSAQTFATAEALRDEYQGRVEMPTPLVINDVNDPVEYRDRVNEIYARLPAGWNEQDVIADYTGMTAHGSVGVALACLSPLRSLQYTPALYNQALQSIASLDPIEIVIAAEKSAPVVAQVAPQTEPTL